MYILPLVHRVRDTLSSAPETRIQSAVNITPTPKTHPTSYIVIAIILAILLLALLGYLIVRRRLFTCTRRKCVKVPTEKEKRLEAPRMQREGRSRFTGGGGFDMGPALSESSPKSSSEGPPTPPFGDEHDYGDIGLSHTGKHGAFLSSPIHQTTLWMDPDLTAPDPKLHVHFFDELSTAHNASSAIRPHGLPLSPVPEEASGIPTLPSIHFDQRSLH